MISDTFFCLVFTRRKKWERSVWKKKRAKWRKGKERLQIANNHSYCLDVSIFFICAPFRGLNTETQCIIECSGLIAWYSSIDSLLGRGLKGRERGRRFQTHKKHKRYMRKGQKWTPSTHLLFWQTHTQILFHTPFEGLPCRLIDWKWSWLEGGYFAFLTCLWIFCFKTGAVSFGACSILQYEKVRSSYIHKNQAYFPSTGSKKQFGIRDMVCIELLHECFTVYNLWIFIS